jgi:hypothetical protein
MRGPIRKTWTELDALLSWREGWNGYDAGAPKREAIDHASVWIGFLYEDVLTTGERRIAPNVVADADGNVVFEWWKGQKKLTLYFHPETVRYVKVWGPDIFSEMENGDAEGIEACRMLWTWLAG